MASFLKLLLPLGLLLLGSGCLPEFPGDDDASSGDDDGDDDTPSDDDDATSGDDDATPGDDDGTGDDDDATGDDDDATGDDDDATGDDDDATSSVEEDTAVLDKENWEGYEEDFLDFSTTAEDNGYFDCTWEWTVSGVRLRDGVADQCSACAVVFDMSLSPEPDDCVIGNAPDSDYYGLEPLGGGQAILWIKASGGASWSDWGEVAFDSSGNLTYTAEDGGSGTIGDGEGSFQGTVAGTAQLL